MRKMAKSQPPSYWVQLLYEQVERARAERQVDQEGAGEAVEGD